MKRIGLTLAVGFFCLTLLSPAQGSEPIKLGYVDMQKALNTCEAGKEAKKVITEEVEKVQNAFLAKQKDVEKIKEDLERRGSVLSEPVRREKEKDYQTKLRDLQRIQRDSEEDIRRKDRELHRKNFASNGKHHQETGGGEEVHGDLRKEPASSHLYFRRPRFDG